MVDVQVAAVEKISAVLTSVPITLKHIQSCEFDFFFREPVKQGKNDDSWNSNPQRDGLQHLGFRIGEGEIPPTQKIMGQKIPIPVGCYCLCMSLIEKCQGSSRRAGIDSLPQPVEYKYRLIEQCIHDLVVG